MGLGRSLKHEQLSNTAVRETGFARLNWMVFTVVSPVLGIALIVAVVLTLGFLLGGQWFTDPAGLLPFGLVFIWVYLLCLPWLWEKARDLSSNLVHRGNPAPNQILTHFTSNLPRSLEPHQLDRLIQEEALYPLGIEQSLLLVKEGKLRKVFPQGLTEEEVEFAKKSATAYLDSVEVEKDNPVEGSGYPDWVRLSLPLWVRGACSGMWLLGHKHPDDHYSSRDISVLRLLSRFILFALRNAELASSLHHELVGRTLDQRRLLEANTQLDDVMYILETTQSKLDTQEHMAAIGQLAADIAHELNNALTPVKLFGGLMAKDPTLSPKGQEWLTTILCQTDRAISLNQSILEYSQKNPIREEQIQLDTVIKAVVESAKDLVPEGIDIEFTRIGEGFLIFGDPDRIHQAIENLMVNAGDAMPKGGRLRMYLSSWVYNQENSLPFEGLEEGEWVRLDVEDTGHGIDPAVLPHIFEPFFTTRNSGHHRGLGLSQVFQIVNQHHGYIDVASESGCGTRFSVYFPTFRNRYPVPER